MLRRERVPPVARPGRGLVGGQPLAAGRVEAGWHLETRRRGAHGRNLDGWRRRGGQPGLGPAGTVRGSRIGGGVVGGARIGLGGTLLRRRCGTLGGHHEPVAGRPGAALGG
ncbi:hypothetical protein [Micromonospora sp. NPDC050276]|uniref:hypothetical protein n=1 Tax=Micromonospora sp. NPDC050276 TaxID=3364278 RepID=UPI0037AC9652